AVPIDEFVRQFSAVTIRLSQADGVWDENFYQSASIRQNLRLILVDQGETTNLVIATMFNLPTSALASTTAKIER
ncbi:MAG: hypothetical protein ACOYM8_19100, partial [Caulobacterales bacterium]